MQETLVSKETAILARDKRFNWDTSLGLSLKEFGGLNSKVSTRAGENPFITWDKFDSDLRMPTQSLLQKWLRDMHNIHIEVWIDAYLMKWNVSIYDIKTLGEKVNDDVISGNTFEEVLEKGLIESLKLIKNENMSSL